MRQLLGHTISFRSPSGALLAHVALTPARDVGSEATAPLVEVD